MIIFLACIVFLTGCWNRRELRDLCIVTAIGIDKGERQGEYLLSFQVVNPGQVAPGAVGGGSSYALPITIYTSTGETIIEAIREASKKTPRQLFFSHVRLVVIGEALAKDGIKDMFDFFERLHETRLNSTVLISRGSEAKQVLKTLTSLEKIPANSIIGKSSSTEKVLGENLNAQIDDIIKMVTSEEQVLLLSGIRINGNVSEGEKKSNVEKTELPAATQISGMALLKNGKLISWMKQDEARGVMLVRNKVRSTIVNTKQQGKTISIELVRAKTDVKASLSAREPVIQIKVRQEGAIDEVKAAIDLSKPEQIRQIEQQWSDETRSYVESAIAFAKKHKADILNLGEAVNMADPRQWREMEKNWGDQFPELQIRVDIDSYIRHEGMRVKPYMLKG